MLAQGSDNISNAAATQLNGGASLPCKWVEAQNRVGNGPIAVGGPTIAAVAADGVVLQAGASIKLEVEDIDEVWFYATNLNDPIDWTARTRR